MATNDRLPSTRASPYTQRRPGSALPRDAAAAITELLRQCPKLPRSREEEVFVDLQRS